MSIQEAIETLNLIDSKAASDAVGELMDMVNKIQELEEELSDETERADKFEEFFDSVAHEVRNA